MMSHPSFLSIAVLALFFSAISAITPPISSIVIPAATVTSLRSRLQARGGCKANVCFALDGSSAMPAAEFEAQKNFVLDLTSIIGVDQTVELAAVQYATFYSYISQLTSDVAGFTLAIDGTTQIGGLSRTAIGIGRCGRQLLTRPNGANKIILLGDGNTSIGRSALRRARRVSSWGIDISVVAAGEANLSLLQRIAGGRAERVFDVHSFLDVLALQQIIEKLVGQICGTTL